jgi:hypothetical protein
MSRFYGWLVGVSLGLTLLLPAGAFAKAPSPAGGLSRSAQEQAVLNLEQRILQGRVDGDPSVAKADLAEEAMYMHSTGWAQTKDQVLEMVAETPWASWTESEVEVHLYGDAAVTHSLLAVLLNDKRTETVRTTGVYVKRSGRWRQVSWQSSMGKFVDPAK